MALKTAAADRGGLPCRESAPTPATCGDAIEVPLMVLVAVVELYHDEVMLLPGAKMSTHVPQLENEARASVLVVAPTEMAVGALPGEVLQASWFSFPAATASTTPALVMRVAASFTAWLKPPPSDMLATAGSTRLFVTQSIPAITPELVPLPEQSSTRTAMSVTPFATP